MKRFLLIYALGLYTMFLISTTIGSSPDPKPRKVETVEKMSKERYEFCRDKLFKKYPHEVDKQEWRECLHGND